VARRSIKDLTLDGRRVLIRVDFNVPIKNSVITDDTRIRASLPTIEYAIAHGAARVILCSHLGRPKGKPNPEYSLRPVATRLAELIGRPVAFADDCVGEAARTTVENAGAGGVVLLENLRFHAEEEKNDPAFAKELASLADVYVNDAFGSAHRAHASTEAVVRFVKESAAGFLMAAELEHLGRVLEHPDHPFVAVLGGAKVSDKLEVIQNFVARVDALLIGGAMAYTFFKSRGVPVGKSLVEEDLLEAARDVEQRAAARHLRLELPVDHVDAAIGDRMGLDIGPQTIATYRDVIAGAKTVIWNGPMGVFEIDAFATGTVELAKAVAAVKGTTVVGGGDSIAAVAKAGVGDKITHISTGGGASLEFLGGRSLPGVVALEQNGN
jgi:phosphoglycerate kinase